MMKLAQRTVAFASLTGALLIPVASVAQAQTPSVVHATSQVASTLTTTMPVVRLHFTSPVLATQIPNLKVTPNLSTRWQQIGPRDIQAVAVSSPRASMSYAISLPSTLQCAATCSVTASHVVQTSVNVNLTWETQLLAELNYLPVSFTPTVSPVVTSEQVPGVFAWRFPSLPARLSAQWKLGVDNVILDGAMMNFQEVHGLATTGVVDAVTWNTLVNAVDAHQFDPASYNYVDVNQSQPQMLTLFVNGAVAFHSLVNTGIPQSPTATGTYPVYLRYTTQTMSGTNPNGTHYSDPGIPWVSYFNGGDALHGFIRSSYGYPQSLGCVEMPFANAALVWPHTPIGTLVTVRN